MSGGNNGKALTVSRKLAKILLVRRKSPHPFETLYRTLQHKRFSSPVGKYEAGKGLAAKYYRFTPNLNARLIIPR